RNTFHAIQTSAMSVNVCPGSGRSRLANTAGPEASEHFVQREFDAPGRSPAPDGDAETAANSAATPPDHLELPPWPQRRPALRRLSLLATVTGALMTVYYAAAGLSADPRHPILHP